ncbi:hypothetical protein ACWPKS_08570 [Coraliomargarita sp. W4R72]
MEKVEQERLIKHWKVTEVLLEQGREKLPNPSEKEKERFKKIHEDFLGYLQHNEHEMALDMLESMSELVEPRGGFWRHMKKTANHMKIINRDDFYDRQFDMALQERKGHIQTR